MSENDSVRSIPLTIFEVIAAPLGGLLFGFIGVELFLQGYATQTIFLRAEASGSRLPAFISGFYATGIFRARRSGT